MTAKKDTGITNIRGKEYQTVALRVQKFREAHPAYALTSTVVYRDEECVVMQATIADETGRVLANGHAEEYRKSSQVNKTSALENAETSAIGRALAAFGFGGTEFASANEVQNAIHQQGNQPSGGMPDDEYNRLTAKMKTAGVAAAKLHETFGVLDLRQLNQEQYGAAMKRLDKTIADKAKAATNEQANDFAGVDNMEFAQ